MSLDVPITPPPFKPPLWLRSAFMQTAIASQKFRKRGTSPMEDAADSHILNCGNDGEEDVRLLGSYSANDQNKALVIFLHGWEGSENSTYVVSCARYLYERGCSVFRLNFRDHGDSHHLNKAMFHSARLAEVRLGVEQAVKFANGVPVYLVGFSLGGNFALRIARQLAENPIENLAHIFAISPVTDPLSASPRVDDNPLIRSYFYKKWTTSMSKKQAAFPEVYDFSELVKINTVMELTEKFLPQYTEFQNPVDYFNAYKISSSDLLKCPVDVSVIMSKDDPVIPAEDVATLQGNEHMKLIMTEYGGHNGFFTSLLGPTWYDTYIEAAIMRNVEGT